MQHWRLDGESTSIAASLLPAGISVDSFPAVGFLRIHTVNYLLYIFISSSN